MRILWTHNFDPREMNNGVFMYTAAKGVRDLGVDLTLLYLGNLRSVTNLLKAREHVKQLSNQFDLVHAQYGSACAVASAAAEGIPKVLSIRGNDWNVHSNSMGFTFFHTRLARLMTRLSIAKYDCILSVSKRIASEMRLLYPRSYIAVLPSPIDLEHFVPRDQSKARSDLGYHSNKEKWILFTSQGLDDSIKRYGLAKQAVDIANLKIGNIQLRIANGLPHEDIPLFVATCNMILCTSETEGWPNSIKEALACNLPFVSTDVSDLSDIAVDEPRCRICPPNPFVIADNICDVLSFSAQPDLRKYVSEMSIPVTSQKLILLYESLIANYRTA